jgi:copper chaperone
MQYSFEVENIRCGGCTNTITKKLREIGGVKGVHVNVEQKQVIVSIEAAIDANIRQTLSEKLAKLGYPEVGTIGSDSLMTKATSVVSCAIGKVSNKA